MFKCTACGKVFEEKFTLVLFPDEPLARDSGATIVMGNCDGHPIRGNKRNGPHFVKYDDMETIKKIMKAKT